ncbi:MAG: transporter related, partial [Frankiales bacterium]|nr:transporter related [Frankiales bacterium]
MAQFIYSMQKVRKAVGDKVILDDVTLSFLPGAKIGVVGPNGAGKSTVLKMMAGLDQPSNGDAKLTPGFTVGMLMQEPVLDETRTVRENVEDGVKVIRDVLLRYEELNEKMGAPDADFEAIMAEQEPLLDQIEAANAWELDSQIEQAMDALRCSPCSVVPLETGSRPRTTTLSPLWTDAATFSASARQQLTPNHRVSP